MEGIQTILDVAGIFWNGADLINMVISLCMGDWKAAWWYGVCALPFIGEKPGAGGKWLTSSTRLGQAAKENKVLQNLTLVYKVPAGKLDDFARYLRDIMDTMPGLQGDVWYLIDGQEIMNGNSCISFHICEEASETVCEDVWRLGDEPSWLFGEIADEEMARRISKELQHQGRVMRKQLEESIVTYRQSEEYLKLSNTKRNRVEWRLQNFLHGNIAIADVSIPELRSAFAAYSKIHSS